MLLMTANHVIEFVPEGKTIPVMYGEVLIPVALFALAITAIDISLVTRADEKRLKTVLNSTKLVADKDYTEPDLVLQSREEFGLVFNNINNVKNNKPIEGNKSKRTILLIYLLEFKTVLSCFVLKI